MNRIFFLLLMMRAMPSLGNETDSSFTVKGYLAGEQKTKMIYLRYNQHVDSTQLKNGRFEFKGFVSEPVNASLWCEEKAAPGSFSDNRLSFYLDPVEVRITSMHSLYGAVVNGGRTESEQQVYDKLVEPRVEQRGKLVSRKYNNRDSEDSVIAIAKEVARVNKEISQLAISFVTRFPDSYVSLELIKGRSYGIEPDVLEPMLNALNPALKESEEVAGIIERLNIAKLTSVGKPALEFTQTDVNGKPVSLSSFRGKYVLVDFWASWCGFCRLEHPNMLKLYNRYKDKGFTVLGVSLDDAAQKEKWLAAIKEDKLPWQQVCDLKGRDNEVARLYGIKGIPQNVLIDPNGIIVAKNLRGDDLTIKLMELLGD